MSYNPLTQSAPTEPNKWLRSYYFARAAISIAWVLIALTAGKNMPGLAAVLFLAYPAWDAIANFIDAQHSGGLKRNPTQAVNAAISAVTTIATALALGMGMNVVLTVFGVWAALSGLLQFATAIRRWKNHGAQWAMILSGAQSTLAGVLFIKQAGSASTPGVATVAPYAAFGAFYFLVSAIWLTVTEARRRKTHSAGAKHVR